jgi:AcrR family transcriptional regulator
MSSMNAPAPSSGSPATRMPADERRVQLLDAATRAFAKGGYHGTSTDAVAREAGVSQPYVVRTFGTKLELFLQVFARATDRIRLAFEAVLDEHPFDPDSEDDAARLGTAYTELLADRALLQIMMHGYSAGGVDEIAALSRECMASIVGTILRTGWDADRCRDFIAHGMLINVMLSMHAPEHLGESEDLDLLAECTFGDTLALVGE